MIVSRRAFHTCLLVASLVANPVAAAGCDNASNTHELNACAEKDFASADQSLNTAYKAALAHVAEAGGDKPYDSKSWETALRTAQRSWLAYREADCKGAVPMEWSGGTGTTAAVLGCMTEKTKQRTDDLDRRYTTER